MRSSDYRTREWRKLRGITQTELSQRIGTKQPNIATYEAGMRGIVPERADRIAKVFGITKFELRQWPRAAKSE